MLDRFLEEELLGQGLGLVYTPAHIMGMFLVSHLCQQWHLIFGLFKQVFKQSLFLPFSLNLNCLLGFLNCSSDL